ncbi:ChbG/HpnK family deacetylase [Cupriavidus necator]|uniref:ChbG/HpnK family deacetylase n=1 Tax=Cupriavidus necator TaxID=106590 RepID=UPI003F731EE8
MRSLIINADDFGMDDDTFLTTVSCFEAGLLTSATIMTGCAASALAYDYARQNRRRFSFGLHFNIVDGHAAASMQPSSLCGEAGVFRQSRAQRLRALAGWLTEDDIRRELRHQLTQLRDHGVEITHIDSHGHLHKFPVVIRAIRQEMTASGIRWVRRPQNFFLIGNARRSVVNRYFARHFEGLSQTDYYGALDAGDKDWPTKLPGMLPRGLTEISVHPGQRETWRYNEAAPLLSPDWLASALARAGIALRHYGI